MYPNLISRIGYALWGSRWQTAMAAEFGISDRTVRRWAAGQKPPDAVFLNLYEAAKIRKQEVDEVLQQLEAMEPIIMVSGPRTPMKLALAELRRRYGESFDDMAARLNVSRSFLANAAVNVGRSSPASLAEKVVEAYDLSEADAAELRQAAEETAKNSLPRENG